MSKETPSLIFSSDLLKEEKNIIWKVPNFSLRQKIESPKNGFMFLEFEAGESIKRPSKWRLELKFTSTNEIGFYLALVSECRDKPDEKLYVDYFLSIILDPKTPSRSLFRCNSPGHDNEYMHGFKTWGFPKVRTVDELRNTLGALVDDTLILYVQMEMIWMDCNYSVLQPCTSEILNQNEHNVNEIGKQYGVLLETGESSDFVIRVKDLNSEQYVERRVHRIVLSTRSPVFKAMVNTQMLENSTGIVTIGDLSPKGLDVLLEFIYTGNLHDDWKIVSEEIINAAEKYDFPLIKTHCDQWLHTVCTKENAFTLLKLARTHELLEAYKNISIFIKSNFDDILSGVASSTNVDYPVDRPIEKSSKKCVIV